VKLATNTTDQQAVWSTGPPFPNLPLHLHLPFLLHIYTLPLRPNPPTGRHPRWKQASG